IHPLIAERIGPLKPLPLAMRVEEIRYGLHLRHGSVEHQVPTAPLGVQPVSRALLVTVAEPRTQRVVCHVARRIDQVTEVECLHHRPPGFQSTPPWRCSRRSTETTACSAAAARSRASRSLPPCTRVSVRPCCM